ncbi:MAG: sensor histidine kinase, partial [Emergencia sp.]
LHMTEFDLTEMVRDVWEESSMIDQTHPYVFQGDRPVMVTGDTAMLKQSLRILVQNASKYSRPGDTVSMGTCLADGAAACFVQDEGIGMGDSEVIHVFERFYRSDAARNSAEGGTGLGLSIAKWIVDAHRGEIRVLSRPGLGTRFTIKLPREQDDIRQK